MNNVISETDMLHEAILYATWAHKGQVRKGTDLDYICHPLEVLQILTTMRADTGLLIAGVLHDVVEDTKITLQDIALRFGSNVAAIVEGHTEDKTMEWMARKKTLVDKLEQGGRELKMLVLADKISNLRSIVSDMRRIGEKVWDKFGVTKEYQCWYYTAIKNALEEMREDEDTSKAYQEMTKLYERIFGEEDTNEKYRQTVSSSL